MHWLSKSFELHRGGSADNVRPMEGLRGFAVFLVFLVHYVALLLPWIPKNSPLVPFSAWVSWLGGSGVDLFFVLSGYLIYGSLIARAQPFPRFMRRRIRRIYPAFSAVFLLYVALSLLFPSEDKIPRPLSAAVIYLIQNFLLLPGIFPIQPMITVAWSLSYEMFYYLAIPLLIVLFRFRSRSPAWRVSFVLVSSVALAVYCAIENGPIRLAMFGSGILLFEAVNGRVLALGSMAGAVALGAVALVSLLFGSDAGTVLIRHSVFFTAYFVLCVACFREPSGWLARAFSWTPMRWLGNMSYSYYLLHGLALKGASLAITILLPSFVFSWWMYWSLLLPMFLLTLVPSAALFLGIERPYSLASSSGADIGNRQAPPTNAHATAN